MSEKFPQPTAAIVMEGRAPLPADAMPDGSPQTGTRQTHLPPVLEEMGVRTIFVEAGNPKVYDAAGDKGFTPENSKM